MDHGVTIQIISSLYSSEMTDDKVQLFTTICSKMRVAYQSNNVVKRLISNADGNSKHRMRRIR